MSWWEFRARVTGQVQAMGFGDGGPAGSSVTPERYDEIVARFADV